MNFLYVLYDCADLIRAKKEIRLFFVNFFEAVLQSSECRGSNWSAIEKGFLCETLHCLQRSKRDSLLASSFRGY